MAGYHLRDIKKGKLGELYRWGERMDKQQLFQQVYHEACSCDLMYGFVCRFCKELKDTLKKALGI